MKWGQYFLIMAAIYYAPNVSKDFSLALAAILTVLGLIATWRKE